MTHYYIGIDIGSTATKVAVLDAEKENVLHTLLLPTGWSGKEAAERVLRELQQRAIDPQEAAIIATGYGRVSVPYAQKTITEISCHGRGAAYLHQENCTVIDIGGQDTKIISVENGNVTDFIMNDKCSAGTGRFLEIMATTLGVGISELFDLAEQGGDVTISSMCTVFAESEVISLIGSGRSKEDIAFGVVDSISEKVASLCGRHGKGRQFFLTGGFCDSPYLCRSLGQRLQADVATKPMARYAGALGAALLAK